MQSVAGSLKQSETAFLLQRQGHWLLRWFTPTCEVPLCGHATLASLLALHHWGHLRAGQSTRLFTRSGALEVGIDATVPRLGHLQLPGGGLRPAVCPPALELLLRRHLGCGASAFWSSSLGYRIALLPEEACLASMPSPAAELPAELRRGLVLMQGLGAPAGGTAALPLVGGMPADYQLRFFAPGLGIEEDPVTGSAHALVAPYWMERLGRDRVVGWQCSDRPGGMVARVGSSGMIRLSGSGYLLWDGRLLASFPSSRAGGARTGSEDVGPSAGWSSVAAAGSGGRPSAIPS
jgi:predicted PhzF superfamily epimerase YddE/YHI9